MFQYTNDTPKCNALLSSTRMILAHRFTVATEPVYDPITGKA
ncbi:hypothetical protein [Paenibacillus campi]|nr:hypothetical protein [Paenibacillus sp. SGZ-1009]